MALLGLAAAADVCALGIGRVPGSVPFGAALDLAIPLRLEPGESLQPACVVAELSIGERRLPASAVRVSLEGRGTDGQRVRVRTALPVEEPVLTLDLAVGCGSRVMRRALVLVDPPTRAALPGLAAAVRGMPAQADAAPAAFTARPATATAAKGLSAQQPMRDRPTPALALAPQTVARGSSAWSAPTTTGRAAPASAHLALEPAEPPPAPAPLTLAAQDEAEARAAAIAAQAAASAAMQRVATLEQGLDGLRADAQSSQAALAQMRSRLADAEGRSRWFPALLLWCALLMLLVAWLALRLRALQRERRSAGLQVAAQPAAHDAAAAEEAPLNGLAVAALPSAAQADWRASTEPLTAPVDAALPATADALVDLEQQAEFFVVLGQDDAAIELWAAHLRSSGGVDPLPYLKLLQIHKRRQDRPAFERTRRRFAESFDTPAPEWDAAVEQGPDLLLPLAAEAHFAVEPRRLPCDTAVQPRSQALPEGRHTGPVDLDLSDSMLPGDSLAATLSPLASSWQRG